MEKVGIETGLLIELHKMLAPLLPQRQNIPYPLVSLHCFNLSKLAHFLPSCLFFCFARDKVKDHVSSTKAPSLDPHSTLAIQARFVFVLTSAYMSSHLLSQQTCQVGVIAPLFSDEEMRQREGMWLNEYLITGQVYSLVRLKSSLFLSKSHSFSTTPCGHPCLFSSFIITCSVSTSWRKATCPGTIKAELCNWAGVSN